MADRPARPSGEDHPDALLTGERLAAVMYELGEYERAGALLAKTLFRSRKVLGEDHPQTLRAAENLAKGWPRPKTN